MPTTASAESLRSTADLPCAVRYSLQSGKRSLDFRRCVAILITVLSKPSVVLATRQSRLLVPVHSDSSLLGPLPLKREESLFDVLPQHPVMAEYFGRAAAAKGSSVPIAGLEAATSRSLITRTSSRSGISGGGGGGDGGVGGTIELDAASDGGMSSSSLEVFAQQAGKPKKGRRKVKARLTTRGATSTRAESVGVNKLGRLANTTYVFLVIKGEAPATGVRFLCSPHGISLDFRKSLDREVMWGGSTMKPILRFLCEDPPDSPKKRMDLARAFLLEMFNILCGAAVFMALASPGMTGGCTSANSIHGTEVLFSCVQSGDSVRVHIGEAASKSRARGVSSPRQMLELSYRYGDSSLTATILPCTCVDALKTTLEIVHAVLCTFGDGSSAARARFSTEATVFDGFAGMVPHGDGRENPMVFSMRHVAACIRYAFDGYVKAEQVVSIVKEFKTNLRNHAELLRWRRIETSVKATGVLEEASRLFLGLCEFAGKGALNKQISYQSPWCELPMSRWAATVADSNVKCFASAPHRAITEAITIAHETVAAQNGEGETAAKSAGRSTQTDTAIDTAGATKDMASQEKASGLEGSSAELEAGEEEGRGTLEPGLNMDTVELDRRSRADENGMAPDQFAVDDVSWAVDELEVERIFNDVKHTLGKS